MKISAKITGADGVRMTMKRLAQLPKRALAATAEDVEDYVESQAATHHKTGALVRSIYKRPIAGGWEVGHDLQHAPHAVFVHWGTRPHSIKPRRKKAMRWPAGGAFAFARRVQHPGYKGDAWMVRAAALAPQMFHARLRALLGKEK